MSESIFTFPFIVPGSVGTTTFPVFPTRDSVTVVDGGIGWASLWYSLMVARVTGNATATATIGDHMVKRTSGTNTPISPRITRTTPGMSMNAPGLSASMMMNRAPATMRTIATVNGSMKGTMALRV